MLQTDRNHCVISMIYAVVWRCCWSHLNDPRRKQESGSFLSQLGPVLTSFWSLPIYHLISASITLSLSLHPFPSLPLNGRLSSYQSFLDILNEMNDYAGQRELIAENMMMNICIDLTKYLQELKQERKTVSFMWRGPGMSWVGLCKIRSPSAPTSLLQIHWMWCISTDKMAFKAKYLA